MEHNGMYIGFDLSFAKTGYAVVEVKDGKVKLVDSGLIKTDNKQTQQERIDYTSVMAEFLAAQYRPKAIIKEASVVGRSSTAMPVLKTHGAYEQRLYSKYPLYDFHNASIKKWARDILNVKGNDKKIVGNAVNRKFGEVNGLYTARGKYNDDIGDAIACVTAWLERESIIEKE
ncbi:crossover junction endodeoxyribonuclease RuvC [Staphylococcus equorum]|uniref:crossover junction endodeoxyribonuclease RuvC n=1 Tax=Staphylococcus equorum TaxID=246432 RepID=UPI001ED8CF73|nr:crossover junction endodeoxyribonuclease RuvC [Staphylococcus equorum]